MKVTHSAGIVMVNRVRTIKAGLEQLHKIAEIYEIEILPGNDNDLDYLDDQVIIHVKSNQAPRKKLWVIAHELGHVLASLDYPEKVKESLDNPLAGSFWELEDELQAWAFADIIIKQLNIGFYDKEYIKWKHLCLKTYYRQLPEEE